MLRYLTLHPLLFLPLIIASEISPPRVAAQSIDIGSAAGIPGAQVQIATYLSCQGKQIGGLQLDIAFDPINTPVAIKADGTPDCTFTSPKGDGGFGFLPSGCTGSTCDALRAIVLSFSDMNAPMADGCELFTCKVNISPLAPPQTFYFLTGGQSIAGDPHAAGVPITIEENGVVIVNAPGEGCN